MPKPNRPTSTTSGGQTLEEWWKEDAERLTRLGEAAAAADVLVGKQVRPPPLNPDGSLKNLGGRGK